MNTSSRGTIVGSIGVSIAFVMELTVVPLLLPSIQTEFDLTISQVAWFYNSYGIAVAIGVLLGGFLGDVLDTKKVFGLGVMLFALGSATVAFYPAFDAVIFGRVIQGLGGGIFSPLVPLLLTRAVPDRPGKVLIIWGSVTGYVAAFAPLMFSHALIDFGWPLAFVVLVAVSIVGMLTVFASIDADEPVEVRTSRPNYLEIFKSRELVLMFVYVFCTYGSITYFLFRLPLWISENSFEIVSIGAILSTVWLSFSFISTSLRNHVDGPTVRIILVLAPILIGVGFPIVYFLHSTIFFFVAAVCIGSGLACSNAPSTQMILKYAPKGMSAASTSLDITFARIGGVLTVALFSRAEMMMTSLVAILLVCCVAVAMALLALRGEHSSRQKVPAAAE